MVLWASAFIAIRAVGEHYSPGAMALGRLIVGSLALSVVAALRPLRFPRGRTLVLVVAYGVLWFGLYAILINSAERHLDAGTTR
jgi:drug/metabolite transporter (DMT)-like permease